MFVKEPMRKPGGKAVIMEAIQKLAKRHNLHIKVINYIQNLLREL